jgi:O-antigen ligase
MDSFQRAGVFIFIVSIISLFLVELTPVLLSISIIVLAAFALANFFIKKKIVFYNQILLAFFFFLFLLLSTVLSNNNSYGVERILIKLPILAFLLSAGTIHLHKNNIKLIKNIFISIISLVSIGLVFNYLTHYDALNKLYEIGQVMPTPIHHIRYSILVLLAINYLIPDLTFSPIQFKLFSFLKLAGLLFLIIFIHILGVRTSLVALYFLLVFHFVIYIKAIRIKFYRLLIGIVISFVLIGILFLTPSIRLKIEDTQKDILIYKTNSYSNHASISKRIISYEAAISIWKNNKIIGCGIGDIKDNTDSFFRSRKKEVDVPILPHNQFLFFMAATGLIGLLLFVMLFYYPFFSKEIINTLSFKGYVIIISLAFMTEPMLETQLGVAVVMIFYSLELIEARENSKTLKELVFKKNLA